MTLKIRYTCKYSMANIKKIVILGAGFGGLRAALDLGKKIKAAKLERTYQVILIDQNAYQTYTPTLYEIATTSEALATQLDLKRIVTFNIEHIIAHLPIEFIKARVAKIDVAEREIHFESGTRVDFDYAVVALGSQVNYFNIPGLADNAYVLKTIIDALRLREKLIMEIEDSERKKMNIIVGGGGSTGVELAAEITLALQHMNRVACGKCGVEVTIIDGAATVLAPFGPAIITRTEKRLKALEINTLLNARIAEVEKGTLKLQSGSSIPYDLLIWTGGVAAHMLMLSVRVKKDSSGTRVLANNRMQLTPEEEQTTDIHLANAAAPDQHTALPASTRVYGIGDAVCFIDPKTNRPVPGVARAAIVQGGIAAHNIFEEIKVVEKLTSSPEFKDYTPRQYPYIIPVGGKHCVARFGPIVFSGFSAWLVKGLVEGNYLFSILPFFSALRLWFKGLWIFMRNDRLG